MSTTYGLLTDAERNACRADGVLAALISDLHSAAMAAHNACAIPPDMDMIWRDRHAELLKKIERCRETAEHAAQARETGRLP